MEGERLSAYKVQSAALGGVFSYFARHRTLANLLLAIVIVAGLVSFPKLRAQFFPDVVVDNVSVTIAWPGAGPADMDRAIVQLLEPALLSVDGVTEARSVSRDGRASITLDFEPGWDMARAVDEVRAAAEFVSGLPDEAEDLNVRRGAWRDNVTEVYITGPVAVSQLALYADELVARLFESQITRTNTGGVAAPRTIVEVPEGALVRFDVSMAEIATAIARETEAAPAGDIASSSARVRTGVERRGVDEIERVVIRSLADGTKLYVSDLATVRVEGVDRAVAFFVGESPAVTVRVDRTEAGDAIRMQAEVERIAADLMATLPEGVEIGLYRTRAEAISGRLQILLSNGLNGLALVVALLFLFLSARTAFWVAVGIPVAMLATLTMMFVFGFTLNMISLFALIITLGIVVDDAIVIGEHADFRYRNLGESPYEAAENAAARMALPVFSAMLTTVIAFFALTSISGRFGSLIADIPFTVIVVLIASLFEVFLILPNHMAHSLSRQRENAWYDWPSTTFNKGFRWVRLRLFRPLMGLVIAMRYPVVAAMLALLAGQAVLLIRGDVPWRFFSAPELGSVSGNFAMAPGATRADSLEMVRELQRAADELGRQYEERYGTNPVAFAIAQIGGGSGRALAGADTKEPDQLGGIAIELIDADLRPYSSFQFVAELQNLVRSHPMLETLSFRGFRGGPGGSALDVSFYGADATVLKEAAEALKAAVAQFPEVSAVEDNLAYDKDELSLELTPQGMALGFSIDQVGRVLRNRLGGVTAVRYPDGPRTAEIRVELPKAELTADFLDRTLLRTPAGPWVPLSELVSVTRAPGFSAVRRENGLQIVGVTGDISEDDPRRAEEITRIVREEIVPRIESDFGVAARIGGLSEQENTFIREAATGFALALLGIFLVLAWVFASWTRPVVVMSIIPFGLIGAVWGHKVWDVPLTMFSVIGIIGMTGIIINNAIVLVTTIDDYARDRGIIPAIIDGATDRLRPILLTTLTTVLGLSPLLYETSQQAQFLKPSVIALAYGLGFGMVIVLLLVPALLAMQSDVQRMRAGLRRALATGARGAGVRGVTLAAGLAGVVLFGATLGHAIVLGGLPAPVTLWLGLPQEAGPGMALGLFAAGLALVCLVAVLVGGAVLALTQRRVRPSAPAE